MKLTKATSIIIASVTTLIAAIIGGYFAIQAATQPVLIQIHATQTAEAKFSQQSATESILLDLAGAVLSAQKMVKWFGKIKNTA